MPKRDCIFIDLVRPLTKHQLLEEIKKELDKEIPQDTIRDDLALTININRLPPPVPEPPQRKS